MVHLRYFLFFIFSLFFWQQAAAQVGPKKDTAKKTAAIPHDIKVLSETKDKNGNITSTIQYTLGNSKVIETVIIKPNFNFKVPVNPDTLDKDSVLIIVNKSKSSLEVFYKRRKIRAYKAVFGPKPLENKMREGDRCTPEGW